METLKAVFCFDDNLTTQVQAAAASLVDACRDAHCEIHCVCTSSAGAVEGALRALIGKKDPDAVLRMHCVENPYADAYEVRGISAGTYLRLTLPSLLPEVDRILYLDADVLILESLLPLWKTDLGENLLAAVKGPVNLSEKWEWNRKRSYWHLLEGMKGCYINAGVTLLNLAGIRKKGLEQRWNELTQERFYYQDQDILNITCQGEIVYLPPKYNRLAYLSAEDFGQLAAEGIYTETECAEAQEHPAILHYAGDKPWKRYDTNLGALWWEFVNKDPELAGLFDEERARKYHGPSLIERVMRRVRKIINGERV